MGVLEHVEPIWTEIVGLLGELAGNEAAWAFTQDMSTWLNNAPDQGPGWQTAAFNYTVPGQYPFELPGWAIEMRPDHPDWSTDVDNPGGRAVLRAGLESAWQAQCDAWTNSAVPTVYRSASRNIWEPDPAVVLDQANNLGTMTRFLAAQTLGDHADWTVGQDAPEWLRNLRTHWPATSASSENFYAFWDDVNDKCALYLLAAARLAAGSAQAALVMSDFQTNLRAATELLRDRVKEALLQWQTFRQPSGMWPTGAPAENMSGISQILGGISLATGAASLTGPAAIIAGPISLATGFLSYIFGFAVTIPMEMVEVATAQEIHDAFLEDLRVMTSELEKAFAHLKTIPQAAEIGGATGNIAIGELARMIAAEHDDWKPLSVNL